MSTFGTERCKFWIRASSPCRSADGAPGMLVTAMQFSVGVNYLPRSSGPAMWHRFDVAEIRSDFEHIAALGLDGVRIFLRWDAFAPEADRIDPTMLERLDSVIAAAAMARIHILPVLFTGHVAGVNYLPEWALDRKSPAKRFRTFTGDRKSKYGAANIYGTALRAPQLLLARTVGERYAKHPSIRAWDIGNAFSDVREPNPGKLPTGEHSSEPVAEREIAAWSDAIARALRETSSLPVTAGTSTGDLARDRNLRFGTLCAPLAFASMQGLGVENPFSRNRLDPEATPFLAMLAAAFSFKPVLVTGFGNPTCPAGKFSAFERFAMPGEPPNVTISAQDTVFATYPCVSEEENAAYCTAVLQRLQSDGRLGAYWWSWTDYAPDVCEAAPFDRAPHEAACGLLRSDGTEKPVAQAIAAFARCRHPLASTEDMPMIAAAYYYRTLPKSAKTLYDAFLRFTQERRASLP